MNALAVGKWVFSLSHGLPARIVETEKLWGVTVCHIWLPEQAKVERVNAADLTPLHNETPVNVDYIVFLATAARIKDALTKETLLAPLGTSLIPLPHQLGALSRAVAGKDIRFLLADEVGLGKTIEAGLIMRELKLRGLIERTLIVAPKGLVTQWVAEMQTHFGEEFKLLLPGEFGSYRQVSDAENVWLQFPQVICPLDSVKPVDKRSGWSQQQLNAYNRDRFENLINADWDLIIVDEAHRLGGTTDQVARHRLGQGLSESAPYLLLLSATPHQGKADAFHRLISLLDAEAFPDVASVTREKVQQYVIRTPKREAIDVEGKPLFKPRQTQLLRIAWTTRHRLQRRLYDAVTEYVRYGYNQAMEENRQYIGFLMILMQRLVASSTQAIAGALERRLETLDASADRLGLAGADATDDWFELDGQTQLDALMASRVAGLQNERLEIVNLLRLARQCQEAGPDVKAQALLDWIYRLQQLAGDPELRVLIFTEFVDTQAMLVNYLSSRGFSVAYLNGSMTLGERQQAQETFANEARVLVSTDAGGEGLNLQFCHVVVNYDMPWNPMRLEQRIGRIDRIGQKHEVWAINFVLEDSVDHRVLEVLEQKLALIYEAFGVDKTTDVLDSVQTADIFEGLYVQAILDPDNIAGVVDKALQRVSDQVREQQATSFFTDSSLSTFDLQQSQQILAHPLPNWVEHMATSYVRSQGGQMLPVGGNRWRISWPRVERMSRNATLSQLFSLNGREQHLTLDEPWVRSLLDLIGRWQPEQQVPVFELPGLAAGISGFWALWQVCIEAADWQEYRIVPLFLHANGRLLAPTAQRVWDLMVTGAPQMVGYVDEATTVKAFARLTAAAEERGMPLYYELKDRYVSNLQHEREKGEYAWTVRRRAIERIGLPEVRSYRLRQLDRKREEWQAKLGARKKYLPELIPLLLTFVKAGEHDG